MGCICVFALGGGVGKHLRRPHFVGTRQLQGTIFVRCAPDLAAAGQLRARVANSGRIRPDFDPIFGQHRQRLATLC